MGILVRLTILLSVCATSNEFCSTTTTTSDLPILVRSRYENNISTFDLNKRMLGHVDLPDLLIRKPKARRFGGGVEYEVSRLILRISTGHTKSRTGRGN